MDQASAMDGRQSAAQHASYADQFLYAKPAALLDHLRERPPLHELHPETRNVVELTRAVNVYDVGMTDPREMPRLTQIRRPIDIGDIKQFDGNIALQIEIPRAVDAAEPAGANLLAQLEIAPASDAVGAVRLILRRPVHVHQSLERLQFQENLPSLVGENFSRLLRPVDAGPARHGVGETPDALV